MKILFLNTYDNRGGAAVAAWRIYNSLAGKCETQFGTLLDENIEKPVIKAFPTRINKFVWLFNLSLEKLFFLPSEKSKKERFAFSTASTGIRPQNILKKWCPDIIHIHWFNQGFFSLNGFSKLIKANKPIVWTLHDMWAFTGGCHYSGSCHRYRENCGNCPLLHKPSGKDLSYRQLSKKRKIYNTSAVTFVTCSNWLREQAVTSNLLSDKRIEVIPNPIDTNIFCVNDKTLAREKLGLNQHKKYLLFTAGNVADPRKGLNYLLRALNKIHTDSPELADNLVLLLAGKNTTAIEKNIPVETKYLGYLTTREQLVQVYNAADLFLLPSLEDNLPNTIMEALSCGTPCIAFKTGGIPEMIEHLSTGYLAEYKSDTDLANGILWAFQQDMNKLSVNARKFAVENYSEEVVGNKYYKLYQSVISKE
ncbi:MAG: glycosyltransferase family 4 protein [Bacteroidales bacterium]|nr:glycosyltransferase family 4 protein [Bacteroidales bacterium]MBN2821246.1 glycosyltransferase family 4 protein [Bacteroidales bacterium]